MKENYTIDEILLAVEDLQIKKRAKSEKNFKKKIDSLNSNIPKDTLKLIEEAEKSQN